MTVYVSLECGPAGTSLDDVVADITSMAKRLDLPVICSFNGVELMADPSSSMKSVFLKYEDDLRFKIEVEKAQTRTSL
jgi:hypothetical protein